MVIDVYHYLRVRQIKRKLKVSQPNEPLEREADQIVGIDFNRNDMKFGIQNNTTDKSHVYKWLGHFKILL